MAVACYDLACIGLMFFVLGVVHAATAPGANNRSARMEVAMDRDLTEKEEQGLGGSMSRRGFIAVAGMAAVGGVLASSAMAAVTGVKEAAPGTPPPLPWQWVKLDPMEAGKRTFQLYHTKGG